MRAEISDEKTLSQINSYTKIESAFRTGSIFYNYLIVK